MPRSLSPAALLLWTALPLSAQPVPTYDFDFVTVTAPGNAPYTTSDPFPPSTTVLGRGRVDYAYRIGRTEVTTGQWLEFQNAFASYALPHPHWSLPGPAFWGAIDDLTFPGPGTQYRLRNVADAERLPVFGITWRMAALYSNWLHNGKSSDPASLLTGAYDTSTWGVMPGTNGHGFSDGLTHLPGAKFWIPTLDEWLKAVHYDPHRYGPDEGGWWLNKNGSDEPGIPGPPGQGTTSAGYRLPQFGVFDIPLGAYPQSQSPWGLLDTSGGAQEWTEHASLVPYPAERGHGGTGAGSDTLYFDIIYGIGSVGPGTRQSGVGLRIASVVPGPGTGVLVAGWVQITLFRRKRR